MKNHLTISVILPVYNGEDTILATVQSVLQQSFTDFELIIVNDGSTDATLDVLSQIKDTRLQILSHDNAGVSESRNRGMKKASGDYIAFIDADDLWIPQKLERQLAALQANPNAAVAYSWTDYIDESDRFIHSGWHAVENGDVYKPLAIRCFVENGSNILFKRAVLDQISGFDKQLEPTEDWDFFLRLAERFQYICVPEVHVRYRIVSGSQSTNLQKMEKAGTKVLQRTFKRSPERLRGIQQESWADYYSYLFHKGRIQAQTPSQRWMVLKLLFRGLSISPVLFKKIAKRHIFSLIRGFFTLPQRSVSA